MEDYEKAIEVERKKHQKILAAKQRMLAEYEEIQRACDEAQMAFEQLPGEEFEQASSSHADSTTKEDQVSHTQILFCLCGHSALPVKCILANASCSSFADSSLEQFFHFVQAASHAFPLLTER